MRDMSEVGLFRLNARCHFEGLGDTEMGRMRFLSQRIDDQTLDAGDTLRDFIRHSTAITEIGDQIAPGTGEHVTVHLRLAVWNGQRRDFGFAQIEWSVDEVRLRFQIIRSRVGALKREHENALQVGHGFGGGVDRHGPALPGKPPQIIETHDVIGM